MTDIYKRMAAKALKIDDNQVTKEQRYEAKIANFAKVWGSFDREQLLKSLQNTGENKHEKNL